MFNDFPTKIKKMIFARVRHTDLYEVAGVSREWWALAMATCSTASKQYNDFLDFQVKFCNEMKPKDGGWKKWMFVEFTDDKSIQLLDSPDEKMIEYFRQKGVHVRKLIYKGYPSILPNLKHVFPLLETLNFTPNLSYLDFDEALALPSGLKHLSLTISGTYRRCHLTDLFKNFERVDSLFIDECQRILFDGISFDKLKNLHLDMYEQSTNDIKLLITGSKQLSTVHLKRGLIDNEWFGLFPTNMQKIHLEEMRIDEASVTFKTAGAFVERNVMRYICQDWTRIRLFKSSDWSGYNDYNHSYVCRPQTLEEELGIVIHKVGIPKGLLDSRILQLKVLHIIEYVDTKTDFDMIVPKSVKQFEWHTSQLNVFNFAELIEDISAITSLRISSFRKEGMQFRDLPLAPNLVSLHISHVDDIILASILTNCPSLKQLSLRSPQGMPFSKLQRALKSPSVKELLVIEPKDPITDILGHFPKLTDLHLQCVYLETVTMADLAQLTSLVYVRITFKNGCNIPLIMLVGNLNLLPFSHIMLGYSSFFPYIIYERLACVMCTEKAFFRRYSSSNSKTDFTRMNIRGLVNCFSGSQLMYFKGVSSLHLVSLSKYIKITHDLQDLIAEILGEYK